ncbi:MAG: ROK family glucokinase [Clostridiales bacterium]|jgi:glucokinase|nr:ROK family glucokinase [Clostridiales bacterium]
MKRYCYGVDIGGTGIKVGLFDVEGNMLDKWVIATRKTDNGKDVLKDAADFLLEKSKEKGLTKEEILGVGVGIPGPVKDNGDVLELANLGLGYFNLEEEMSAMTGYKVKAANDANVAALGEQWKGKGKGYENMVLVTLGTGVGGGVIHNGKIVAGSGGAGGEIGHFPVNFNEEESCGCGKRGCLEQYASATGIVRLAKQALKRDSKGSLLSQEEDITSKLVFDYAKKGDELALEIVDEACRYLGIALAGVAQVVDPEAFVIGGGVSKAGDILTSHISKHYKPNVMKALRDREFLIASLGNDAGIYGCARLILTSNHQISES